PRRVSRSQLLLGSRSRAEPLLRPGRPSQQLERQPIVGHGRSRIYLRESCFRVLADSEDGPCKVVLAASEQPHHQRKHDAQQDTGHHGKIENRVLAPNLDVPRKAAELEWQLISEREQESNHHERRSEQDQRSPNAHETIFAYSMHESNRSTAVMQRVGRDSIPLAAGSNPARGMQSR